MREQPLQKTNRKFQSYQGNVTILIGVIDVDVEHGQNKSNLELYIFYGRSRPIIDRDSIQVFNLVTINTEMNQIIYYICTRDEYIQNLFNKFLELFSSKLRPHKNKKRRLKLSLNQEK